MSWAHFQRNSKDIWPKDIILLWKSKITPVKVLFEQQSEKFNDPKTLFPAQTGL